MNWRRIDTSSPTENPEILSTEKRDTVAAEQKSPVTWAGRRWDVFISYSWHDAVELADTLRGLLQESGLRVFVDRSNSEIGEELSPWIEAQLKRSGVLLVLVTPNAQENDWVKQELDYFRKEQPKAPVVPVFVEPCQPGDEEGPLTQQLVNHLGFTLAEGGTPSEKNISLVTSAAGRLRVRRRRTLIIMGTVLLFAISLAGLIVTSTSSAKQEKVNHWSRVLENSTSEARWRFAAQASQELQALGQSSAESWRDLLDKVLIVPMGVIEIPTEEGVLDILTINRSPFVVTRSQSGQLSGYLRGKRLDLGNWGEDTRANSLGRFLLLEDQGRIELRNVESGQSRGWNLEGNIDGLQMNGETAEVLLRTDQEAKRLVMNTNGEPKTTVLPVNFGNQGPQAKLEEARYLGDQSGRVFGLCKFGTDQTRFIVHKWTAAGKVDRPWEHLIDQRNVSMMGDLRPSRLGQGFVFWYLVDDLSRPLALTPDASITNPGSRSFYRLVRDHESAPEVSVQFDASQFEQVIALDGYQAIGVSRNGRGTVEWIGLPEATIEPPREFVTDGATAMAAWPAVTPSPPGARGADVPLLVTAHEKDRSIRIWSRRRIQQKLNWPDDDSPYPPYPTLWVGEGPWIAVKVGEMVYFWESIRSPEKLESGKDLIDAMNLEKGQGGELRDSFQVNMGGT